MLKCDWCGSDGKIIGDAKSFPGTKVAKCDVCHHEWETRVTGEKIDTSWLRKTVGRAVKLFKK